MLSLFFFFMMISSAFAVPLHFEVWFLSAHKKADIEKLMNQKNYVMRSMTAALQCQEMGDNCFDPQYGLYKKSDMGLEAPPLAVTQEKAPSIPAAQSVERELINCDPKNYFDIFCGKSKKEAVNTAKLEMWIDTSGSMREMDFSDKEGGCFRKSMMTRLDATCGFNQKVNVMMFDTSIKQAGAIDSLCVNQGLNDTKRLIDWIERSTAKHLIILTDINEFNKEFGDYIESKHGIIKGDKDPMIASDLLNMVDALEKTCR